MINHVYNDFFYKGSTDKQWKIKYSNGVIGNANELFSESIQLEESLCSEPDLLFGCCEASIFKFKVANIFTSLKDEWLDVSVIIDDNNENPLIVGKYKVLSDNVTADKQWRDIVAYDAMYDIIHEDVSDWYNTILPTDESTVTMRQFRKSFVEHFGLQESESSLVNDDMVIKKTISIQSESADNDAILEESALSGLDVITAICEINGCFGHIGRDGKFHYIYLSQDVQGLYPADFLYPDAVPKEYDYLSQFDSGSLYPQDAKGFKIDISNYITCEYEDYHVKSINKLQIRQEENDIGVIWQDEKESTVDNCYVIQGNFLVYGKSSEELSVIAENIYKKIKNIIYRPFTADCPGNICLEVGDSVRISTNKIPVESYILKRTLKGIQDLRDLYSSTGKEVRSEEVNSVHSSINQLKGKANVLSRTIEETKSTIIDTEKNLQTQITQNSEEISLEATRATKAEGELSGKIEVASGQIVLKVDSNGNIAEVNLGIDADDPSATKFQVTAKNIDLTAEEAINLIAGGTIALSSKDISIESDNLSITSNGEVTATAINIEGGSINLATSETGQGLIDLKNVSHGLNISIDFYGYGRPSTRLGKGIDKKLYYLDLSTGEVWERSKLIAWNKYQRKATEIAWEETIMNTSDGFIALSKKMRPLEDGSGTESTKVYTDSSAITHNGTSVLFEKKFYRTSMGTPRQYEISGNLSLVEDEYDENNNPTSAIQSDVPIYAPNIEKNIGDIRRAKKTISLPTSSDGGGFETIASIDLEEGVYSVSAQVNFASNPANGRRCCRIMMDGEQMARTQISVSNFCILQCTAFIETSGGTVSIEAEQDCGATLTVDGYISTLKIK